MSSTNLLTKLEPRKGALRGWAWMWLAYTGFLFIEPIMDPSWRTWTLALATLAVFLVIFYGYFRAMECGSKLRYWMVGATFVLGLGVFPFNAGATTFFVYTAAFLPFALTAVPRVLGLFALEAAIIFGETWWLHLGKPNAYFSIFLLLIVGGSNIFFAEQKRADSKLRAAQEENIALAAVAERERIARDLHDVLGHTLSVIVLKAELAGRLLTSDTAADPARAATEIADVERTARTALAEVREAIGGYRTRGLLAEIEAARRTLDAAGVALVCEEMPATSTALSAQQETVLALGLREAVTNIVRHAQATRCTLRFVSEGDMRRLVIEDNGVSSQPAREGNGLRGMRERVQSIGGELAWEREHGTRLSIGLPALSLSGGALAHAGRDTASPQE